MMMMKMMMVVVMTTAEAVVDSAARRLLLTTQTEAVAAAEAAAAAAMVMTAACRAKAAIKTIKNVRLHYAKRHRSETKHSKLQVVTWSFILLAFDRDGGAIKAMMIVQNRKTHIYLR
jgi:hypothetical protein